MRSSLRRVPGRLRWVIIAGLFALFVIVAYLGESVWDRMPAKPVVVVVPELSEEARAGADVAFALAIQRGVRSHHWKLGDMPPQPGLSAREIETIVRYVRELQQANGIE